ncbi:MAG: hypothetical protein AAF567_24345 [Actinomycetota bacterium]
MSEKPPDVMRRGPWNDNAEMIAEIGQRLDLIRGPVLDLTYGHGAFWRHWRPDELVTNDLHPAKGDHSHDVRGRLPEEWHRSFKSVFLDVPYRMAGTKGTGARSGDADFDEAYGLDNVRDRDVPYLLCGGVVNAIECVARAGRLFVKCQDGQWSGGLYQQTRAVEDVARALWFETTNQFELPCNPQPQPGKQRNERSNSSILLVLKKRSRVK